MPGSIDIDTVIKLAGDNLSTLEDAIKNILRARKRNPGAAAKYKTCFALLKQLCEIETQIVAALTPSIHSPSLCEAADKALEADSDSLLSKQFAPIRLGLMTKPQAKEEVCQILLDLVGKHSEFLASLRLINEGELDLLGVAKHANNMQSTLSDLRSEIGRIAMKSFFISYNKADKAWAEWIAWTLEEAGHMAIIQAWDFLPGSNFVLDMQKAFTESDKTIAVLSDNYLKASFTQPEWAAAFAEDPRGLERKLVPVRVADCKPEGLLAPIVYIDLVGMPEADAKMILLGAFSGRIKPSKRPVFPGISESAGPQISSTDIKQYPGAATATSVSVAKSLTEKIAVVEHTPTVPKKALPKERFALIQRLTALNASQLNMLAASIPDPIGVIPPMPASNAVRAPALLECVESPGGCGVDVLEELLEMLENPTLKKTPQSIERIAQEAMPQSTTLLRTAGVGQAIVWLHLSDLHLCKPKTGWDAHRVLRTLQEKLTSMESKYDLSPQMLFFTGDAAYGQIGSGAGETLADQFDEAHQLFEVIREAFHAPIPRENVFIVPGNHDINRDEATLDQTSWLDSQSQQNAITQLIQSAGKQWERYMARLLQYRNFLEQKEYKHMLSDPKRLIYAEQRDIQGLKVGIGGFNSAWSSCRDKEKGKLWMGGDWQSGELMSKLYESDLRIAIMHHPFGWFVEQEDPEIRTKVERDFHFFLHGHEHQGWVDQRKGGHVRIAASASYAGSGEENGINFVRLNVTNKSGEVWLLRYDSQGGGWVPKIIAGKTDNNGCWNLGKLQCLNR